MADYGAAAAATPPSALARPHTRDCYTSEDDEDDNGNCRTTDPPGGKQRTTKTLAIPPGPGESAKKPRGRPPGPQNKPKPPIVITKDSDSAMHPTVLQLSAGIDVVETVFSFARRRQLSICVLSGTGAVANVTLRHPTCHASTITLHGRFDILSLSGGIIYSSHPSSSSSSSSSTTKAPSFTISITGAQGQVIGGTVAGSLIAAGPVVLVVASFANPSYHRLPSEEEEAEEGSAKKTAVGGNDSGNSSSSGSGMSMSVYSVAAPSPLNCQISSEVLPWALSSRPPHHY